MNTALLLSKEMKIIESPKKTREEVWREASAITRIGDYWEIPLLFGVSTDRAPFYLVLQFYPEGGGGYFRNIWVGTCRWDHRTLNLYQSYFS